MEENTVVDIQNEETQSEQPSEPSIEDRAKMMGWIPPEEFKGDKNKLISAEDFVSRAEHLMPVLKTQLKKFESKYSKLESDYEQMKKDQQKMITIADRIAKEQYDKARKEIMNEMKIAAKNGDDAKYEELEKKKSELSKEDFVAEPIKTIDPLESKPDIVKKWVKDNEDWYGKNVQATLYAEELEGKIAAMGFNGQSLLDEISKTVFDRYPSLRGNSNREKPSAVVEGAVSPSSISTMKNKHTFSNLPKAAQEMCDRLIKQGTIKNRDQYISYYQWD